MNKTGIGLLGRHAGTSNALVPVLHSQTDPSGGSGNGPSQSVYVKRQQPYAFRPPKVRSEYFLLPGVLFTSGLATNRMASVLSFLPSLYPPHPPPGPVLPVLFEGNAPTVSGNEWPADRMRKVRQWQHVT